MEKDPDVEGCNLGTNEEEIISIATLINRLWEKPHDARL